MERIKTIQGSLFDAFENGREFTTQDAYDVVINQSGIDAKKPSIRARIYEAIDKGLMESRSEGVYVVKNREISCLIVEGDGRDLSWIEDNSIDAIINDHPYDVEGNKGGNRNFASSYDVFKYDQNDFNEKVRVLKDGHFLVEFIPEESATNYEYLYQIKEFAKNCGLEYYAKVSWLKGDFVANTGRKSKNCEDVLVFSKGKARSLRFDAKANKRDGIGADGPHPHRMSGTNGMLPTAFNFSPPKKNQRIHQAEKPVELIENILSYITLENEIVLDQFAGSGVVGEAAIKLRRNSILIELNHEYKENIYQRLSMYDSDIEFEDISNYPSSDLAFDLFNEVENISDYDYELDVSSIEDEVSVLESILYENTEEIER